MFLIDNATLSLEHPAVQNFARLQMSTWFNELTFEHEIEFRVAQVIYFFSNTIVNPLTVYTSHWKLIDIHPGSTRFVSQILLGRKDLECIHVYHGGKIPDFILDSTPVPRDTCLELVPQTKEINWYVTASGYNDIDHWFNDFRNAWHSANVDSIIQHWQACKQNNTPLKFWQQLKNIC